MSNETGSDGPQKVSARHALRGARFIALCGVGLTLLVGSLIVRFVDQPHPFTSSDKGEADNFVDGFAVGADAGSVDDLRCPYFCPMNLTLTPQGTDSNVVDVVLRGNLTGVQKKDKPARIVLLAPQHADSFILVDHTDPATRLSVRKLTVPSSLELNTSKQVDAAILTFHSLDQQYGSQFYLKFRWHPNVGQFAKSGLGRRNLRLSYFPSNALLREEGAYAIYAPTRFDSSVASLNIHVCAGQGDQIIGSIPDPDQRPEPDCLSWKVASSGVSQDYFASVESRKIRFLVGVISEQTLFIAGLLLGAALGAITSDWLTARR